MKRQTRIVHARAKDLDEGDFVRIGPSALWKRVEKITLDTDGRWVDLELLPAWHVNVERDASYVQSHRLAGCDLVEVQAL